MRLEPLLLEVPDLVVEVAELAAQLGERLDRPHAGDLDRLGGDQVGPLGLDDEGAGQAGDQRAGDAGVALGRTVSSVFDLLKRTFESGERELQLVQSQQEIAEPRMQFEVSRLR